MPLPDWVAHWIQQADDALVYTLAEDDELVGAPGEEEGAPTHRDVGRLSDAPWFLANLYDRRQRAGSGQRGKDAHARTPDSAMD